MPSEHFATLSLPDLRDLYGKTMDDLRIASRDGRCASAPLLAEVLRRNLVNLRTEIDSRVSLARDPHTGGTDGR